MKKQSCPGCQGVFPEDGGETHSYIGASSGCWKVYGAILAKEFGEFRYPPVHRLTVDTYCVQHPGESSPQSIQSVGIHLVALYLALEMRVPLERITAMMDRLLKKGAPFVWLTPPENLGNIAVLDIMKAATFEEHEHRVWSWAREVWDAWESRHLVVKGWYEELAVRKPSDIWL